jgi:hypothetical protein
MYVWMDGMGASTGLVTRTGGGYGQAWWRAGRAQLHSQYSWRCHGVWSGENSWYWMAREQAWPPTEHPSPPACPSPFVTTHSDNVPSVAPEGNVKIMLSKMGQSHGERPHFRRFGPSPSQAR